MKQAKPLLTIKQKCRYSEAYEHDDTCSQCKGTGEQEIKIYALRDFEKYWCFECGGKGYSRKIIGLSGQILSAFKDKKDRFICKKCNGTGYKIPKEYEPYEIKKVSEITDDMSFSNLEILQEHNLKRR